MTTNRFLTIAASAMLLSFSLISCNNNDILDDSVKTELRLSSGVEAQSRTAFPNADTQIVAGQNVIVFVDEVGDIPLYERNVLTADGNGGLSGGTRMYFPESGRNVNIYAIHTNATWTGDAFPATALTHRVSTDQRTLAEYAASDLLYARTTNIARTSTAVGLTFYHLLSKVQIAVVPGRGLTASDITGITIGGTHTEAVFTLDRVTYPSAIPITASGPVSSIIAGADVSENFTTPRYNDAIIVPQTVAANTPFITVHLRTGYLIYRLPAAATFGSGRKYIFHITANLAGLTLTTSIRDWTPINPVSGNAVLE